MEAAPVTRCIDWEYLETPGAGSVRIGDRVSAAAGGLPIYRVMAIDGGRAWLREESGGVDRVLPIQPFHWKACGDDLPERRIQGGRFKQV